MDYLFLETTVKFNIDSTTGLVTSLLYLSFISLCLAQTVNLREYPSFSQPSLFCTEGLVYESDGWLKLGYSLKLTVWAKGRVLRVPEKAGPDKSCALLWILFGTTSVYLRTSFLAKNRSSNLDVRPIEDCSGRSTQVLFWRKWVIDGFEVVVGQKIFWQNFGWFCSFPVGVAQGSSGVKFSKCFKWPFMYIRLLVRL